MIKARLLLGLVLLLGVTSQKDEDEGRPYEFSFTIDGEQHRHEKKDVSGIVQGEFGFITGDGVYHVTVYATDENGSFKILSMKNTKISEPLDRGGKPTTAGQIRQPTSNQQPTGAIQPKPVPPPSPPAPPTPTVTSPRPLYDFTTASTIRNGCSNCGIVTKAPPGPLKFQNPAFQESNNKNKPPSPAQPVPPVSTLLKPLGEESRPSPSAQPPYPTPPAPTLHKPSGEESRPSPSARPPSYPTPPAPIPTLQKSSGVKNKPSPLAQPPSYPTPPAPIPVQKPSGVENKPSPPAQPPSYPTLPAPIPVQKPSGVENKPSPPAQSSSYPSKPLTPVATLQKPIKQSKVPSPPVQPPSLPVAAVAPTNGIPSGLISKPISPTGQPTSYPNTPLGPSISLPSGGQPGPIQTVLLPPGTKPSPQGSKTPSEQNPFGPGPPVPAHINPPTLQPIQSVQQNQIPPSSLSQATISGNTIKVPGNEAIQIKDKYPNMVEGLPKGITEGDIMDLLYKFNYTVGFHGHYEKGLRNGGKVGGYFVNGRDGISRIVTYTADENGYHPKVKLINLGLDSEDTPKPDSEKKFGLKSFEFVWYPIK